MIGKDIFQNENGILFGFSHLHYSLVLILSMVGIYLMIIQTMPGVLTFIGGSLFFSAVTWTANSILPFGMEELIYRKTEENKILLNSEGENL